MSYSHHSKLHTLERIKPFWHGSIFTVSNSRDHYRCTTNLVKSKCYPQWPTKKCLWTKPPQLTRDILPFFFFNSVSRRARTWDLSFTIFYLWLHTQVKWCISLLTFPSIASLAHVASSSFEKWTKPKPLDLPVSLSYRILTNMDR